MNGSAGDEDEDIGDALGILKVLFLLQNENGSLTIECLVLHNGVTKNLSLWLIDGKCLKVMNSQVGEIKFQ